MCRTILSMVSKRTGIPCSESSTFSMERKRLRKIFKFTELPGLLGEQFFNALDKDEDGVLDADEFTSGFLQIYKGSKGEISQLLFAILDFGHKGFITHSDMRCVLPYLPNICPKCGKSVMHSWGIEEQISTCFAETAVVSCEQAETLIDVHEQLFNDLLEALLNSLPPIFDDMVSRIKRRPCTEEDCQLDSPLKDSQLRPLKFLSRKYFFKVVNLALYGFHGTDQTVVKKLILIKDLFVNPINETEFELKNRSLVYHFEADSRSDRDDWVDRIQAEKKFRWFDDFYETKESIGAGAYGQVLIATSRQTKEKAAVKIVSKENLTVKGEERLIREINVLRFVKHPNLLKLYDVFETFERIYIVTELIQGGTLFEYLEAHTFIIPEEISKKVVLDLSKALLYLHENGIVHRDLKLENIMLRKLPDGQFDAVLIDFGLSCFLGPKQLATEAVGTLKYVAPEILSRFGYGEKADCWSLGVILYILLQGKVPFYGKTDQDVALRILKHRIQFLGDRWSSICPAAIEVVSGLLSRKVEKRWSVSDVVSSPWFHNESTEKKVAAVSEGAATAVPEMIVGKARVAVSKD